MEFNYFSPDFFMDRLHFPEAAVRPLMELHAQLGNDRSCAEAFTEEVLQFMAQTPEDIQTTYQHLARITEPLGVNQYTVRLLFYLFCAQLLKSDYADAGINESLYWDAMADLRFKLNECMDVYQIPGISVGNWYQGFFNMTRFALGRMQYEMAEFPYGSCRIGMRTVWKGDPVLNIHVPSSGAFDQETRLDSYQKAYAFFRRWFGPKPAAFTCESWLLFPEHEQFLPAGNILDFKHEFRIIDQGTWPGRGDLWRIYGSSFELPPEQLPGDTALRRAYQSWLQQGNAVGYGYGIFLFDKGRPRKD